MKKLITMCAVVIMALVLSGMAQASLTTYSIVDYPTYQIDTTTGLTDHVSGTIIADPTTGLISSASFTITGATSYTVAAATFGTYYVHITPTQILVTPYNSSNPLGNGDLRLYGSTGLTGSNSSAVLEWYTPGDPWVAGSNNWTGYSGTVGGKGSGPLFASNHDATPFTQGSVNGTRDTMVVATVPIPGALWLFGSGLIGLMGLRRRFQK